ncbi:MAG TPA: adenylate/guanylate cyclase domain-containing protein, partial [bacterium]|nr:adenylate/guanylate cyclase domain-containing protein [bacterium]
AVNLSSRLETLTKQYHVAVIVGESTRAAVGDAFRFRELDRVQVVGRSGTTRIFELLDESTGADLAGAYEKALAVYRSGAFAEAEQAFAALVAAHPHDGPSATMLARSKALQKNPPAAGWDGVFHQISK